MPMTSMILFCLGGLFFGVSAYLLYGLPGKSH